MIRIQYRLTSNAENNTPLENRKRNGGMYETQ